jgi:hypothetical protein
MPTKRRKKSGVKKPYSKGEMNRLVDSAIHPLYTKNQGLRLLDGAVHAIIEQNPRMSAKKFAKYNLPEIVKKILEKL